MFGAVAYLVLFVGFFRICVMLRSNTAEGLDSGRHAHIRDTEKPKIEETPHSENRIPEEILVRDYKNQYEFFREQYYYPYVINQDARRKTQFGFKERGPAYYNVSDICGMDLSSRSPRCDPTRYRCTKIYDHCRYRRYNDVTIYDCSCSNFTRIPTDLIPANTTHLDLSHTCITSLPANSFENFTALTWLDLSANYFLAELDENVFGNLSQLTNLTIACLRNLTAYEPEPLYAPYELPLGIFQPLVNLVSLNISGWTGFRKSHLKNAEEILRGLSMPSLRNLSLQSINGIHPGGLLWTLTKKVTKGLSNTSLEYLNIQNNVIISIRPGFLENIKKTLKVLDMSYNVVRGGEFKLLTLNLDYMSELTFLNFSYQNYIFFYESSFRSYQIRPNLNGVFLNRQPHTSEFKCYTINLPPRLEKLDLSHRNMIILPYVYQRLCLNTTHSLTYLDMSCSWQDINPFGDHWNMPNLIHLDLSGSKSLLTGKMQFSKLIRLKTLLLAYCYLDEIVRNNSTIWEMVLFNMHMPDLEVVDLSQNYLEYIYPYWINKFPSLKVVYLYQNEFASIDFKIKKAKNLRYLDLSHNHIRMLSTANMDDLEGKKDLVVDLSNNNFECSCQMTDFYFWKKRQNITFKNMYCLNMFNHGKNVSINKITETDFSQCCCVGVVVSTVLYGSSLLLTMIMCMLYRYRWNFVYLWYSWKTFVSWNQRDRHDQDFIFDAFVCYNPMDVDWIVGELCPHLEESQNYRLCIHERDFRIGVPILDNITEAFKASKNIILLVSPNYLIGEYIDFELYLACGQYLHKVTCIMLVDPKSFSKKRPPESLEFLLTTKSYLFWPKENERRRSFWARLRYALGVPLTRNPGNPSCEGYSGLWSEFESEGGGNLPD